MNENKTKEIVKKHYSKIASQGKSCCNCGCSGNLDSDQISKEIGYSDQEITSFSDANLGLGCGNPTAIANITEGDVGGALLKDDYLNIVKGAGFKVNILSENKEISKRQYQGIPLESLSIEVFK